MEITTAPVITIFVRHSEDCKEKSAYSKRCHCPKHLRWTQDKKQYRQKTGTRDWAEAERVKRTLEDKFAGRLPDTVPQARTVAEAVALFLVDKKVQGVSDGVVSRYKSELGRFKDHCESNNVLFVPLITREMLTGYAATWEEFYPSSNTRASVRERVRSFLRYCFECRWLDRIPAVPKVVADEPPTMPLTDEEYERILGTIDAVRPMRFDAKGVTRLLSATTRQRLRALIQLMRWSGLAIQDAVRIRRADFIRDDGKGIYRVVTARQKTGTHVSVPLPVDIAEEILAAAPKDAEHIFWTGKSKGRSQVIMWGSRYVRPLFEAAGVRSGHMVSHRLRDTFAVDLLTKGVPLEEVSKLLGHESIKTTERHYARWIQGRQDRLDSLVIGTWAAPHKRRAR